MGILKTDECDEKTDADRDRKFQLARDCIEDGFTHIGQREDNKDETLHADCGKRNFPAVPHAHADRVGKVGVQSHTGRQCKGQVREQSHRKGCNCRGECGRRENRTAVHAGFSQQIRVYGEDIGHGHEGRDTRNHFCPHSRAVFFQVKKLFHMQAPPIHLQN